MNNEQLETVAMLIYRRHIMSTAEIEGYRNHICIQPKDYPVRLPKAERKPQAASHDKFIGYFVFGLAGIIAGALAAYLHIT